MPSGSGYSVVPVGTAFLPLRIIQLVLGVVVLGMSAYLVSLYQGYTSFAGTGLDGPALAIFTALATMIFSTYYFVASSPSGAKFYNYWALFAVEGFVLLFWLCSFAVLASFVSTLVATTSAVDDYVGDLGDIADCGTDLDCYSSYYSSFKHKLSKRATVDPVSAVYYADLSFCVLNFVLYAVTFVLFTIRLFKHRASKRTPGGHALGSQAPESKAEQGVVESHQWR